MVRLNWPDEAARPAKRDEPHFNQAGSNICLDFHGDPLRAKLVVFSDGNHHMALEEVLRVFLAQNPAVEEVFYTTTPPRVALQLLRAGSLDIGNLRLTIAPHVFISPPSVLDTLVQEGYMSAHRKFMRCRGVVLLVAKDNPKEIAGILDLVRDDVKLFLSNPTTEKISYQVYTDCLRRLAGHESLTLNFLSHAPGQPDPAKLIYGESIHHREAPQAVADGRADVALVFYHLALRYQRIFPGRFDVIWPAGSLGDQDCDINSFHCGLIGDGGAWGAALLEFLASEQATEIYSVHGLARLE